MGRSSNGRGPPPHGLGGAAGRTPRATRASASTRRSTRFLRCFLCSATARVREGGEGGGARPTAAPCPPRRHALRAAATLVRRRHAGGPPPARASRARQLRGGGVPAQTLGGGRGVRPATAWRRSAWGAGGVGGKREGGTPTLPRSPTGRAVAMRARPDGAAIDTAPPAGRAAALVSRRRAARRPRGQYRRRRRRGGGKGSCGGRCRGRPGRRARGRGHGAPTGRVPTGGGGAPRSSGPCFFLDGQTFCARGVGGGAQRATAARRSAPPPPPPGSAAAATWYVWRHAGVPPVLFFVLAWFRDAWDVGHAADGGPPPPRPLPSWPRAAPREPLMPHAVVGTRLAPPRKARPTEACPPPTPSWPRRAQPRSTPTRQPAAARHVAD